MSERARIIQENRMPGLFLPELAGPDCRYTKAGRLEKCILWSMETRVRFAPSPTGSLHVGNVRTALFNWLLARKTKGIFILRIEDTDADRSDSEYERELIEDLKWLGLDWDEGLDKGGDYGPYRQTDRFGIYQAEAARLLEDGRAYYCFCSQARLDEDRAEQQEKGLPIKYAGHCRGLSSEEVESRIENGEKPTLRLRVRPGDISFEDLVFGNVTIKSSEIGDFILLRSDGSPQYNFACVVDDALMKVSHVVRGEGHLTNTFRQVLLYESLGFSMPFFAHLSTILGPDGSKLSKRHGATSIGEFRESGYLPAALVNYLALLGWPPPETMGEVLSLEEITGSFNLDQVNRSPATFDQAKLKFINRSHMKKLSPDALAEQVIPFLCSGGIIPPGAGPDVMDWVRQAVELLEKYADTLGDFGGLIRDLLSFDPDKGLSDPEVQEIMAEPEAREVIRAFDSNLRDDPSPVVDFEVYKGAVVKIMKEQGIKGRSLFRPLRVALTARASGPELEKIVEIVERAPGLGLPMKTVPVRERVAAVAVRMGK